MLTKISQVGKFIRKIKSRKKSVKIDVFNKLLSRKIGVRNLKLKYWFTKIKNDFL